MLMVAQTMQHFSNFMAGKASLQKLLLWRLSGRYQTLIWRPGDMVQNLESPGLSRRVDSTGYIRGGGALGYFLGGYVPPGTLNWHPVLKKISRKIDTLF